MDNGRLVTGESHDHLVELMGPQARGEDHNTAWEDLEDKRQMESPDEKGRGVLRGSRIHSAGSMERERERWRRGNSSGRGWKRGRASMGRSLHPGTVLMSWP